MGWSLGVSKLHFISAYVWQQRCVNKPREENALTIHVSLKRAAITHGSATPSASQFSCMCHKRTPRPQNSKDGVREIKLFVQNSTSKLMILDDTFTRKGRKIQRRKKTLQCASWFSSYMIGRLRRSLMRNTANSAENCDAWRHNALTHRKLLRRDSGYQTQNRTKR